MIDLAPFTVPNFVRAQFKLDLPKELSEQGAQAFDSKSAPPIALRDVSADALSELCDRFRADVFAKAGKLDPKAPVDVDAMIDAVRKAGG
ncbi:MAG: hypothetical protein IPH13_20270 [Planctomycetes bacterium]|nr:hypothetical protein [Planctomycetota bacterium]